MRAMKTRECRLLDSRRRLRQCLRTFSAAWSPWSAGNAQRGGNEPPGWEVSSHKDQLMRQASFTFLLVIGEFCFIGGNSALHFL